MQFPFKERPRRPDEPIYNIYSNLDTLEEGAYQVWSKSEDFWMQWLHRQPDADLITEDRTQRMQWVYAEGNIGAETIEQWRQKRQQLAAELRAQGQGDVLKKRWSEHTELFPPDSPQHR